MEQIKNPKLTDPKGFIASAIAAGIKKKKNAKDFLILKSEKPCICAAVFTNNKVKAAPVLLCKEHLFLSSDTVDAIIVNSGNANAATGKQGLDDAKELVVYAAQKMNVPANQVLMCSTGIIGQRLDKNKMIKAIDVLVKELNKENGKFCSEAILTTDLVEKKQGFKLKIKDKDVVITGIAKGSGMIAPSMATLLGFITTDANIEKDFLKNLMKECVDETFNCITVDGAMSTNDTIIY